MGRRYSEVGSRTGGATLTVLTLVSAATIRPKIYEFIFGSSAAPADQAYNIQLRRFTVAGTVTAVTPKPLDPGDPAALAAAGSNATVEPTYTAAEVMQSVSLNQQATWRWVVPPEEGFVCPATAANGIGCQITAISGGTPAVEATYNHEE